MIKRTVKKQIMRWIGKEKILILKGARQVGKTTLLKEIIADLEQKNNNYSLVYLRADAKENEPIFQTTETLETYLKNFHRFDEKFTFLFIDEFQVIDDAGLLLKNIFDKYKGKIQLIVSGSSSLEITKNTEFLTGRAIEFDISRISFLEYFNYKNTTDIEPLPLENFKEIEIFHQTFSEKIDAGFKEYLSFGGYPEVITTNDFQDKETILTSIIKTYIEKDIAGFLKIENVTGFNNLIKIISSQVGNLINLAEVTNTTGISRNTIEKYMSILSGTYVFNLVTPFFKNIRSELTKMPKIYALDIGLRNYFTRSLDSDNRLNGSLAENFAYLELLRQYKKDYIHFYRTIGGSEIDFVIEDGENSLILCEVKNQLKTTIPLAMKNFEQRYPAVQTKKIVLTRNTLRKEDEKTLFLPINLLPFIDLKK